LAEDTALVISEVQHPLADLAEAAHIFTRLEHPGRQIKVLLAVMLQLAVAAVAVEQDLSDQTQVPIIEVVMVEMV